ncbi:PorT family protein [Flavobacteriaceae bacterium F89]|uniref:PorT family protein n=1 Tax=Cerina litoralis TaxID=2874477 RepID=A0AAE3JPD2_9FLAO|nr:outer membrane beta-barrel protein [Cerina litoralis]MCG2460921.1 PorT family protein [Cerina litoralis]
MSKKSIHNLFQEKFKDFQERPDDKVWDRIETTLDERKKSRNVFPIWWKLGAIAAGLALLLYLLGPFENNNPELPIITNSEKGQTPSIHKPKESKNPAITGADNKKAIKNEENLSTGIDVTNPNNKKVGTAVTSVKSNEKENSIDGKTKKKQPYRSSQAVITSREEDKQWATNGKSSPENGHISSKQPALIAKKSDSIDPLAQNIQGIRSENKEAITEESTIDSPTIPPSATPFTEAMVAVDTMEVSEKKSIFEVLDHNDAEFIADGKKQRWSVEPSIAPVYFNAAGEGSSIAPSFVNNSKSGEVSFSYGVLVSYGVGKKWSIRSGVQKVNYGYSTNDISYTSTFGIVSIPNIDNINYNTNSENLIVQNKNPGKPIPGMALDATAKNPTRTGKMLQQFGYLEVPMEVNYALLDKKFGIDLIGGVSSLFLTDNSVTLESGDRNTELGEANNINSVNFSANFGFGLNYRLLPKVHLNVEPIFKYQLNTFSNTAGSFQPFSIGVYSGLNFKF